MPESAQSASAKSTESFASFLASFTGTAEQREDDWDLSQLGDDVATISYEQALRSHRPARTVEFATGKLQEHPPALSEVPSSATHEAGEKKRKTASITLRLTSSEQDQLHERAAAAQLSVSAYIRSCIFEAEILRAQVKEALARMQAPSLQRTANLSSERAPSGWHARFFRRWPRRGAFESGHQS